VDELGDAVVRIDPDTDRVEDRIQVDRPTAVAADDTGVWVTSETNDRLQRFDPVDGRTLRTFGPEDGIPDGPTVIALAGNGVWVGSDLEASVVRLDPDAGGLDRLRIGGITGGIVVDGGGDVWLTIRAQV